MLVQFMYWVVIITMDNRFATGFEEINELMDSGRRTWFQSGAFLLG
jgi:hypothetical protein